MIVEELILWPGAIGWFSDSIRVFKLVLSKGLAFGDKDDPAGT
ncbi:hypothetical protein DESAMIL20_2025 [Desulfurella amilsii]|uniref:Uncharacterized protein n=1 Tax=Desulfurella amilsii TaxID=1562698 RepID=A0A1X4XUE7_9BACT|nr:hypothetical protein DESAMIL20_2025 [Desulfurella amilsii]